MLTELWCIDQERHRGPCWALTETLGGGAGHLKNCNTSNADSWIPGPNNMVSNIISILDSGYRQCGQQHQFHSGFPVPIMWSAREGAGGLVGEWSSNVGSINGSESSQWSSRETNRSRSWFLECTIALMNNGPRETLNVQVLWWTMNLMGPIQVIFECPSALVNTEPRETNTSRSRMSGC